MLLPLNAWEHISYPCYANIFTFGTVSTNYNHEGTTSRNQAHFCGKMLHLIYDINCSRTFTQVSWLNSIRILS